MGDGNRVRSSGAWVTYGDIHVRDTTWKKGYKAWARDSGAWRLVYTVEEPPSITCAQFQICQVGGNPGCNTSAGCGTTGEQHRVEWTHSGGVDGYHVALHVSIDGGGFVETADLLDVDEANPDAACCEISSGSCDPPDGQWLLRKFSSSDLGACTTTYQYRVRAELDGTDTQIGDSQDTSTETGCDNPCLA